LTVGGGESKRINIRKGEWWGLSKKVFRKEGEGETGKRILEGEKKRCFHSRISRNHRAAMRRRTGKGEEKLLSKKEERPTEKEGKWKRS